MVSEQQPQGTSMSSSTPNPITIITPSLTLLHTSNTIPASLKFLFTGIKAIVSSQITPNNYLLWKSQITKLFAANGYFGYLDGSLPKPPTHLLTAIGTFTSNPDNALWLLVDQNLFAALLSTISSPLLPHLLDLTTCHDIWLTVHHRLQLTNRSQLIQLKHQLYNLSMKDQTMTQYLSTVKTHIDAISATGSYLDTDDVIHYITNSLPSTYQSFKTFIHTNLQPLYLEDF